ncbi:hypothetical protein DV737_g193, partial [Chaetothyriales sp. CBS 132003]
MSASRPTSLNFITSNANKLAEVRFILGNIVHLQSRNVDVDEIQGSIEEIARDKARRAAAAVNGPVLTEDTALEFKSLKGLPGPKYFINALGHAGLNNLLAAYPDKTAYAICTFAFCAGPGQEVLLFQGRTEGKIVAPRGPSKFGWDPVFEYQGKTYAELDGAAKNAISHRGKALDKLKRWLAGGEVEPLQILEVDNTSTTQTPPHESQPTVSKRLHLLQQEMALFVPSASLQQLDALESFLTTHPLLSGQIFKVKLNSKEDAEKMKDMVDLQWAIIVISSMAGAADPAEFEDDNDDDDSDYGAMEVDLDTMYDSNRRNFGDDSGDLKSNWRKAIDVELRKREPQISYLAVLKAYMNPDPVQVSQLNALSRLLVLHGLMSVQWDLKRRDQTSLGTSIQDGCGQLKWQDRLAQSYHAWKADFDTYCMNMTLSLNDNPAQKADFTRFSTATNAIYHTAHITLNVEILDLQIYAGARHIIGRPVTRTDQDRSRRVVKEWVKPGGSTPAAKAAWHAAHLRDGVMNLENWDVNNAFHYPWCLYLATLTCWAFHFASVADREDGTVWHAKAEMNALVSSMTSVVPKALWRVLAFYGDDETAKANLVEQVRKCCLHNGFFQIVGHRVPSDLQENILRNVKRFFALPVEAKEEILKDKNSWNRGYERIGSQIFEPGTAPDLKEGFYIGEEISQDHPYFINKRLNSGPNIWPESMENVEEFKSVSLVYYDAMNSLARDVLTVIGQTLDLDPNYFKAFTAGAVATLRYLHYPPQAPDSDEKITRGIGAHTDFGSVTLLMQDEVDGLQVYEKNTDEWIDVEPTQGAYVVNLGNMFMRWSNDKYISNLHRVINKSGKERYSVPFFYHGNPDYVIECLPNCRREGEPAKYPPISVEDAIRASYKQSYGAADAYKAVAVKPVAAAVQPTASAV